MHTKVKYTVTVLQQFKTGMESNIECPDQLAEVEEQVSSQDDIEFEESVDDIQDLDTQLERNLGALFLKMQTILHISESAAQEVIQINQIHLLSKPLSRRLSVNIVIMWTIL